MKSKKTANKKYVKGANFEREIKKDLEEVGYFVVRSAGSHGIADLVALGWNTVILIQCKKSKEISAKDRKELADLAMSLHCAAVIVSKVPYKPVVVELVFTNGPIALRDSWEYVDD